MTAVEQEFPRVPLLPLYLATLVCSMGMMGFVAAAGPLGAALGLGAAEMGIAAAAGGLGWVLSASAWGRLSDRIGRRRVLLAGVAGFAASFATLCAVLQAGVSGWTASGVVLGGTIAARFAMGTLYSAVPSAGNALIADLHAPADRPGAMGRLGAAQAGGLLLGPAVVAVAAGASPVLPLALLGVLPLAALGFMALRLAEPPVVRGPAPESRARSEGQPIRCRLRRPVAAAFAAMVAVSIAQIVVGFVALDRLGLPQATAMRLAGGTLAAVGVALIAAQVLVGRLNLPAPTLAALGSVLSVAGFLAAALAPGATAFVAAYVLAGFGAGFVFPAISALAANAVGPEAQGRAAGAVTTAFGVGAMTGPLVGGLLYDLVPTGAFLAAAAAMGLAGAAAGSVASGRDRRAVDANGAAE